MEAAVEMNGRTEYNSHPSSLCPYLSVSLTFIYIDMLRTYESRSQTQGNVLEKNQLTT